MQFKLLHALVCISSCHMQGHLHGVWACIRHGVCSLLTIMCTRVRGTPSSTPSGMAGGLGVVRSARCAGVTAGASGFDPPRDPPGSPAPGVAPSGNPRAPGRTGLRAPGLLGMGPVQSNVQII
jgi:hypothetical protein